MALILILNSDTKRELVNKIYIDVCSKQDNQVNCKEINQLRLSRINENKKYIYEAKFDGLILGIDFKEKEKEETI